jgi:GTP:adenosylcobinamide-phosphate guanylyltransferase
MKPKTTITDKILNNINQTVEYIERYYCMKPQLFFVELLRNNYENKNQYALKFAKPTTSRSGPIIIIDANTLSARTHQIDALSAHVCGRTSSSVRNSVHCKKCDKNTP